MNELFSLGRMSRRLGVTHSWLKEQAECGKVPCLKAGNRFLFNPSAVQEVLASKAAKSNGGAKC